MVRLVFALLALILLCIGGAAFWKSLEHLKPEYRDRQNALVWAMPSRYSGEGRRLLRRGWGFQLAGFALLALVALFG